jgi:hypothetical protein
MKRIAAISMLVLAGVIGCVPSIHGIATKENTVWDDGLLGRWGDPNDSNDPNAEVWEFAKGEPDGLYVLTHHDDKGKAGVFNVALVELGDKLFLDIYPGDDTCENLNELSKVHVVPAHTFMRVNRIGNELRIRFMDPDAVKKLLDEQPTLVKHEARGDDGGDGVILTAGSAELQEFLMGYADRIFGDKDDKPLYRLGI